MKITLEQLKQLIKEQIEAPEAIAIIADVARKLREAGSFMKFRGNGKFSDGEGTMAQVKVFPHGRLQVVVMGKGIETEKKLFAIGPSSANKIADFIDDLSKYEEHFAR